MRQQNREAHLIFSNRSSKEYSISKLCFTYDVYRSAYMLYNDGEARVFHENPSLDSISLNPKNLLYSNEFCDPEGFPVVLEGKSAWSYRVPIGYTSPDSIRLSVQRIFRREIEHRIARVDTTGGRTMAWDGYNLPRTVVARVAISYSQTGEASRVTTVDMGAAVYMYTVSYTQENEVCRRAHGLLILYRVLQSDSTYSCIITNQFLGGGATLLNSYRKIFL